MLFYNNLWKLILYDIYHDINIKKRYCHFVFLITTFNNLKRMCCASIFSFSASQQRNIPNCTKGEIYPQQIYSQAYMEIRTKFCSIHIMIAFLYHFLQNILRSLYTSIQFIETILLLGLNEKNIFVM